MQTNHNKIKIIFFILFLIQTSLCLAQVDFRVTPGIIEISTGRGGAKVFSFDLANDGKEKSLRFKIYPMDLEIDRDGGVDFLEIGKSAYSCSKWIVVEPKEVIVEPGKSKKIIAKLTVPAAVQGGGYYSAVVCELIPEKPPKVQIGAVITWRIASLIKVTVLGGKIEKKAVVEDFSLRTLFEKEEEKKKGLTFVASLKNEGNIHIKAEGKVTILTPDRKRKGEVDFDVGTGTVLPNHIRDFTAVYDKFLSEGDYIARATFRYGGTSSLEKEIPFSVAVGKATGEKEEAIIIPSLKLIPEEINLKIPAGGFRTAGFTVQNQRLDSLRIQIALDKEAGIQDWFKLQPQEIRLEGGKESKILLNVNIPKEVKEGQYKTKITLFPFLITAESREEKLEPVNVGITIDIPRF